MLIQNSKKFLLLFLIYILGVLFFTSTSPADLPVVLLIVPFLYVFFAVFMTVYLLSRKINHQLSDKIIAVIAALFVVLVLVLGSLRQLSTIDVVLSVAITVLLGWYITKMQKNT